MKADSDRIDAQLQYAGCVGDLLEQLAAEQVANRNQEAAMRYAHLAACVQSRQNKLLSSPRLEQLARELALALPPAQAWHGGFSRSTDGRLTALHVLTEALPAGGLTAMATRWIAADAVSTCSHVVVLDSAMSAPPALVDAVARAGGSVHTLAGEPTFLGKALRLRSLATGMADYVVLHIDVSDIVCATAFGQHGGPPVILVNHTAHTFWTGVGYADLVANCRGSALEQVWAERYRIVPRHCTIPIPIPVQTDDLGKGDASQPEWQANARAESRKRLGLPEAATVLLTVGARFKYSPLPPLDFLSVLEAVLQSNEGALLLVVGFQPDARWQQAIVRTGGRIRVLGRLDQAELTRIHAASDIYVEGFPFGTTTALLEAAYRGVAVALAPLECPPPYSTDGIAVDGVVARAGSMTEWMHHLQSLIDDPELRLREAARIRASVAAHHTGSGWLVHLRQAVASLPAKHAVYAVGTPVPTPRYIYAYWTRSSSAWTWPHDETLEHLLLRALHLGLVPRIDRVSRQALRVASRHAGARHMPLWLVAMVCNLALPVLPARVRARVFRAASFLCRPDLYRRLRERTMQLLGSAAPTGAYEEYRQPVAKPLGLSFGVTSNDTNGGRASMPTVQERSP